MTRGAGSTRVGRASSPGTLDGLVARAAAAYAAAVPEHPADDGFFGPGSVTWRVGTDLTAPVAGLRSLLLQALHPLAMAGVDQHSAWREDPAGRLAATSGYLATVSYGDRAAAGAAAARVRRVHEHVTGVDPVTGRGYAAGDPHLLLWVHATLVESTVAVCRLLGTPLSAADADRYVAEMATAAELVGVPTALVPTTVAALDHFVATTRPELVCTRAARESMAYLLDPPDLDDDVSGIWADIREAAVGVLPEWARAQYGYRTPDPTPDRHRVRQALGVLDALFLAEPGVLEARQRIELRVRATRRP